MMAKSSMLVPPEREGYGAGGALFKLFFKESSKNLPKGKKLKDIEDRVEYNRKQWDEGERDNVSGATETRMEIEDLEALMSVNKDLSLNVKELKKEIFETYEDKEVAEDIFLSELKNIYKKLESEGVGQAEESAYKGFSKGGAVLDLVAAITGKQTKAAKKKMVSEEKAVQDLEKILDKDPRALDDLSTEDYETVVSKLPQRQAAKLGMGDEPLDDMVEMARGMEPAEVAKNLEMFNDIDEIFEYAETLDAKGARQFMDNLSDEDLEIFGADLPDVGSSLGPREVKAHGGASGVAILMPTEYNEKPKDTYDNISPEEKKQQEKDMLPDDEMEDEYVDYVAEKILTEDEQEYLFKALDDNDRLEEILDKIILDATEFTGSGEVEGPGTGISDSIPARLSDGEFVFTQKAVDQIGADKLQKMMDDAEREFDQRKGKALGGNITSSGGMTSADLYNQPKQIDANGYGMVKEMEDPVIQQQEDIGRQMMYSSKVPSLLNR